MVFKLLLVLIFSFLYLHLNPHRSFDVQKGHIKKKNLLFEYKIMYVRLCFLTLVGSKTNSSDNPWQQWIVLIIIS